MASASTLDNDAFASLLLSMRSAPVHSNGVSHPGTHVVHNHTSSAATHDGGGGGAVATHLASASFFGSISFVPAGLAAARAADTDDEDDDEDERQLVRSILGTVPAGAAAASTVATASGDADAPSAAHEQHLITEDEELLDSGVGDASDAADEDDEMNAASILLRVSNSPALGSMPPPSLPPSRGSTKRPRMDSEYSLDTLSEIAAREAMLLAESEGDDDDEEEEEEDTDDAHTRASSRASPSAGVTTPSDAHVAASVEQRRRPSSRAGGSFSDANISTAAKDFFQRRRNGWAERTEAEARAHSALSLTVAGLACVLSQEQIDSYNVDGRIGVYVPAERGFILERYHSKRMARAWGKKIRYTCRKSLADRRVRVKGRFVKAEVAASIASKEITVAGAWVPAVRHEHRVERLLRERSMSEGGAAVGTSPRAPEEQHRPEKRPRRASISALEAEDAALLREAEEDVSDSPYAHRYVTGAASRTQRRGRSVTLGAVAELMQPRVRPTWPPASIASAVPASSPLAKDQEGAAATSATKSALARAVRSDSVASGSGAGKRARTVSFHDTA